MPRLKMDTRFRGYDTCIDTRFLMKLLASTILIVPFLGRICLVFLGFSQRANCSVILGNVKRMDFLFLGRARG